VMSWNHPIASGLLATDDQNPSRVPALEDSDFFFQNEFRKRVDSFSKKICNNKVYVVYVK